MVFYSRFFLHALTEESEEIFLEFLSNVADGRAFKTFVEFRTNKDIGRPKATPEHFRRYIEPSKFISKLGVKGFKVDYFAEGFGLAKFKNDDAHVARIIFS